jgi:DNA-binding CsgD family transcriptional regulator
VRAARKEFGSGTDVQFTAPMVLIEASLALAAGDIAAARRLLGPPFEASVLGFGARYAWPLVWLGLRVEADAAAAGAPADAARSRTLRDLARTVPVLTAPAQAYRALTDAEAARLDGRGQVEAWERAVAATTAAYPLCYTRFRLAEAYAIAGRAEAATATARDCLRLAEELGSAVTRDVRDLARRARLRIEVAEPAADGPQAEQRIRLTDREREVLALVAEGQSNGKIATTLFISPKTASVHVSNILAKLGVTSRTEAATTAYRTGLLT